MIHGVDHICQNDPCVADHICSQCLIFFVTPPDLTAQIITQTPIFFGNNVRKKIFEYLDGESRHSDFMACGCECAPVGRRKKRKRRFNMDATVKTPRSGSTKREKFRYIAEKRTNRALEAIGRISNLSNRQIYEYEEAQVRKIIKALKDAVADVESRFASPKGKPEAKFKLD
jgi:hypothetical protein